MTNVTNWDAGDPHVPAGFETWGQAISEDADTDGRYTELTEPFVIAHEIGHLVDSTTLSFGVKVEGGP